MLFRQLSGIVLHTAYCKQFCVEFTRDVQIRMEDRLNGSMRPIMIMFKLIPLRNISIFYISKQYSDRCVNNCKFKIECKLRVCLFAMSSLVKITVQKTHKTL